MTFRKWTLPDGSTFLERSGLDELEKERARLDAENPLVRVGRVWLREAIVRDLDDETWNRLTQG